MTTTTPSGTTASTEPNVVDVQDLTFSYPGKDVRTHKLLKTSFIHNHSLFYTYIDFYTTECSSKLESEINGWSSLLINWCQWFWKVCK